MIIRKLKIKSLFLITMYGFLFLAGNSFPATINKIAAIQGAGVISIKASHKFPNSPINWKITFYTIDETSGSFSQSPDTTRLTGDSVKVLLVKYSNKYTYYKIFALENNLKDSIEIQVFNKGVREKFLWKNPFIPSKPIPVQLILPNKYSSSSSFLVSMHGANRNATDYAEAWRSFANTNNYVIAAPEFSTADWPNDYYNLGNMFSGVSGLGTLNPQSVWSFFIVREIQRELYKACGLSDSTYTIWGHSAGGQFVHRMALFCPDNLVKMYIAANSGWYTLPDLNVLYPWGLQHVLLKFTASDLTTFTNRNLVIMRGTADTLRDSELNKEAPSDAQGKNRYLRAGFFFNYGKRINSDCKWQLIDVPNVGHDGQKMAASAASFLLSLVSSVHSQDSEASNDFEISSFPNPFNASTQIIFSLTDASHIQLDVYNILGEKIVTLLDEFMIPGKYTRNLNAGNLSSGIYLCRLTNGKVIKTTKTLLIK